MSQPTKDPRYIVLGVCSMAKKANSKPMHEILDRITKHFPRIKAVIFDENTLLNEPISKWPLCDVLISFHSRGFPQHKVVEYTRLRQPYMINELEMQYVLLDRRAVYEILHREGIPHPRYAIVDRDKDGVTADSCAHDEDECDMSVLSEDSESSSSAATAAVVSEQNLLETDDSIEIGGVAFAKPFVEKPVNAENHNIVIYFPQSAGGGSQRLFRKVDNKASTYSRCSQVRRIGSYLYEEFMPTDGTDVKVYTVGPDYTHAEARKAPALDGVVERDADGKEVRYPVILSGREKLIARAIVRAFKQQICGFDLLRANGRSYVCDVNGFSFVKTSKKYYDDCSNILGTLIMRHSNVMSVNLSLPLPAVASGSGVSHKLYKPSHSVAGPMAAAATTPTQTALVRAPSSSSMKRDLMELRCLIAVVRHGDRTPKQKCKVIVTSRCFFELFEKQGGMEKGKLKLKKPTQLQAVLDLIRALLAEETPPPDVVTHRGKFEQIKAVLEMHGHFSGINRKVQFKLTNRTASPSSATPTGESVGLATQPSKALLLIAKWGGELTKWGKEQALTFGKELRSLYPGGEGAYASERGLGLLRLHSTFRHDLKIYASDEGRVQMTAAAFAKGFLALEGELPPILVQMVKSANTSGLLDNEGDPETLALQRAVRSRLQELVNRDVSLSDAAELAQFAPTGAKSLLKACAAIGNPRKLCVRVRTLIHELLERVRQIAVAHPNVRFYHGESVDLIMRRWSKLEKDFCYSNASAFDSSKIPDVYDNVKYDFQHNQAALQFENMAELHECAKSLADLIVPQEYGMSQPEKLQIALAIGSPLLRKILADLHWADLDADDGTTRLNTNLALEQVSSPERFVRTRLYFTSESHLISLLTCLRYGNLFEDSAVDAQWSRALEQLNNVTELNYLSQIVFMVYENPHADAHSPDRFGVELHFSPGAEALQSERDLEQSGSTGTDSACSQSDGSKPRAATLDRYTSRSSLDENALSDDRPSTGSCTSGSSSTVHTVAQNLPLVPSTSMSYLLGNAPASCSHVDLSGLSVYDQQRAALVLPLQPLHNALTLRGLESFLERLINRSCPNEPRAFLLPLQCFQLPTVCCAHPTCYCDVGSPEQQLCASFLSHKRCSEAAAQPCTHNAVPLGGSPKVAKKRSVQYAPELGTRIKVSTSPPFGCLLNSTVLQQTGPTICASSTVYLKRMRKQAEALVERDFLAYREKLKAKAEKHKAAKSASSADQTAA